MFASTTILDARIDNFTHGAKSLITRQTTAQAMFITFRLANRSSINAHCLALKRTRRINALVAASTRQRLALVYIIAVYRSIRIGTRMTSWTRVGATLLRNWHTLASCIAAQ